ncbi:MAG: hypothetical protein HZB46_14475 [Solirubrobacterales bacterium]|nr:hypothetical protein [Solirubrobacterales bacterium]
MRFELSAAAGAATSLLALPMAAQAGTITLDRSCYVEETAMVVTGSGFRPGSDVTLSGDGAFATVTADANGAFQAPVKVPINPTIGAAKSDLRTYTLEAQDFGDATQTTSAQYQVTNFAVEGPRGVRSPRKKGTWRFAGWPAGKAIYGHFRFKGKTYRNYRFGTPKGPCGLLSAKAPLLPARLRYGTWRLQVDQRKSYRSTTRPAYRNKITIFKTFR